MNTYYLKDEFDTERKNYLTISAIATLCLSIMFFGVSSFIAAQGLIVSIVVVAIVSVVALLLRTRISNNVLAPIYLAVLGIALGMAFRQFGADPTLFALMILCVGLALFTLDTPYVMPYAICLIIIVFVALSLNSNIGVAFTQVFAFAVAVICITLIGQVNYANMMARVEWALDKQVKDTIRAESFYEQREQLQSALLQVQHYSSQLEKVNDQLDEANKKTELISQAKTVFLSNMSHELRTPLNVIIGYSSSLLTLPQMFNNVALPKEHVPYVKLIEDNGHYLLTLINDVLDLSKIEAGKLDLHPIAMDLPDIFRAVTATAIGLLKDKPVQLRSNHPDDLPSVFADPMRVRQILLNLLSNAIKFTETGSVTITAHVMETGMVAISVVDTGIGIPPDALAVIFDRFSQAEKNTERKYGGTGLGLDISKQLSIMHGGDLTVESEYGRGSTFTFTLPVVSGENNVREFDTMPDMHGIRLFANKEKLDSSPPIVLVVEDDVNIRQMIHQTLESADYVVITTHSGEEAIDLATGLLPALIILDVYLPGVDGWEVLKRLGADPELAAIPVIVCTLATDLSRLADFPECILLPKPVLPAKLLSSVDKLLASSGQLAHE